LVHTHGESGLTTRLLPFTVDGLIWAASMVVLDASRRNQRVPRLALRSLRAGICATVAPTWRTGWSAWPTLALVGSFELLMLLVKSAKRLTSPVPTHAPAPANMPEEPQVDELVHAMHQEGTSQRAISRELGIDRRRVKRVLSEGT
jgi:hypothetical protein